MLIKSANVEVTTACNAKCSLCQRHLVKTMPVLNLDLDKFKALDWENTDIEYFVLCGGFGDPILHPELLKLVDIIHDMGNKFILHTNGGIFTESWWKTLARQSNALDRVTFGLDGLDPETHIKYRGTSFDNVTRNIRAYVDAGGRATMAFIVFKHNEHQIADIPDFAQNLGLEYFTIHRSRKYNDILQKPTVKISPDWKKPCFAKIGEVSIDLDAKLHICCQAYVRYFFKQLLGDKMPDWLKSLKPYSTFKELEKSIYYNYIGEMDLCNPCGQLKEI